MIDCNTPALHLSERIQIIVLGVENNISFMYNFLQKNSCRVNSFWMSENLQGKELK